MSSRTARMLIVVLLLATPFVPRLVYGTWDTCRWLGSEATRIAGEEVGISPEEMPAMDPRYDWWFGRAEL